MEGNDDLIAVTACAATHHPYENSVTFGFAGWAQMTLGEACAKLVPLLGDPNFAIRVEEIDLVTGRLVVGAMSRIRHRRFNYHQWPDHYWFTYAYEVAAGSVDAAFNSLARMLMVYAMSNPNLCSLPMHRYVLAAEAKARRCEE